MSGIFDGGDEGFTIEDNAGFLDGGDRGDCGDGAMETQPPAARWSIPGDDATPDEWDAFHTALGRPADPSGYEFTIDNDFEMDDETNGFIRSSVHGLNLSNKQVAGLAPVVCQLIRGALTKYVQRMQVQGGTPQGTEKASQGDILEQIAGLQTAYMDPARPMDERKAADAEAQKPFAKLTGEG